MTDFSELHDQCSMSETFAIFKHYQNRLQGIYEDTVSLLNENPSIGLQEHLSECLSLSTFQSTLFDKFSIHILGDSYAAKCQCLNWLLGENVLPDNCEWMQSEYPVTVKHGSKPQLAVTLPDSYVIPVDGNFKCIPDVRSYLHDLPVKCSIQTSNPFESIFMDTSESGMEATPESGMEILMENLLLNSGLQVVLHSNTKETTTENDGLPLKEWLQSLCDDTIPIFVYVLTSEMSQQSIADLKALKTTAGDIPILFWVSESDISQRFLHRRSVDSDDSKDGCETSMIFPDAFALLSSVPTAPVLAKHVVKSTPAKVNCSSNTKDYRTSGSHHVTYKSSQLGTPCLCNMNISTEYIKKRLHSLDFHVSCAKCVTYMGNCHWLPKKSESEDSSSFLSTDETIECSVPTVLSSFIRRVALHCLVLASTVLNRFHCEILDETISKVYSLSRDVLITPKRIAYAQNQEQQLFDKLLVIATHNQMEIMKIISSVKEECSGRITQLAGDYDIQASCMANGDNGVNDVSATTRNIQNFVLQHVKTASAEKLNNNINVLRDSFTGTLSRCLHHLESFDEDEFDTRTAAETSLHLKMILNAAYNVDISIQSSSSLLANVLDKIRQILHTLSWRDAKVMDSAWKCKVAQDVLGNLCESRLAKNMCSQFRDQLSVAHESFVSALRQLELRIHSRLEREEALKHHASKVLSPKIAQLALQSRSLIDELQYGIPKTGKEIGRGMYGVVFTCSSWSSSIARRKKCAVKSVVPQDEKHWNDLALEFYYSICLPPHPRIVELYGSVIDESYGGPSSDQNAVMLIMERMQRDLHSALKRGLSEQERMQIGLDVIEGIRYLHSQGLVHRDIKLKNILMDQHNRAKISDLGFCKPSAMMSGSIVGTPIHMPPELFSGQYDNSVDVYAFGILFWHLCAASVRLPKNYRNCISKDHLWTAVRKGTRPERLSVFRDDCWVIMSECWQQDPMRRPLPGILHARLSNIINGATAVNYN
uniref:Dual serine/threonine and tyrosine protein kinase n=1 Tax=Phallusia mammillata TaxID=59560 RepID=A0A6F9DHM2_9ASCI|nr:uncharacterized protein LOC100185876 [Phallusia mammillata]